LSIVLSVLFGQSDRPPLLVLFYKNDSKWCSKGFKNRIREDQIMVIQERNNCLLIAVVSSALFLFCSGEVSAQNGDGYDTDELLNMSLEELMDMPVDVSGSLTGSSRRHNPSTVTTLTQEDIRRSGARDLDELLDIYIPNFQRMNEYWETRKSGLRGINSDRDDKYLILVNGRVMNEHTRFGALSERDLPAMSDIHHVDVIRGPGSALYGPGGLAMVINIVTESALTFEGTQVTGRVGGIEEFYTGEFKHGKKLSDDSGYFLYAGVSKYLGSDEGESQMDYAWDSIMRSAGWPLDSHQPRNNQGYRNMPKSKLHAQYTDGNFEAWVRYTRGGEYTASLPWMPTWYRYQAQGYQQFTVSTSYVQELADTFSIDYRLSYDIFDNEKSYFNSVYSHREDEYTGRMLAQWTPNDNHSLAFGGEMSYEQFGLKSPGYPGKDPRELFFTFQGIEDMPRWSTTLYSGLAEYQWKMSDEWTTFLGGRFDHHPYTPNMYSPRATLVYTPSDDDTFKLIYSRAVRTNLAADMKITRMVQGTDSDPDKLNAYELRYERQQTKHLWLASSVFYHIHEVTGYNFNLAYCSRLGKMKSWGAEVEANYGTENTRFIFSHAYTKMLDYRRDRTSSDILTAAPYGFGDDMMNWSNHQTKLTVRQELTDEMRVDGSVRTYWGWPGFVDYMEWQEQFGWPRADRDQFKASFFLNLGAEYEWSEDCLLRLDGHDLLGFFDEDVNNRLYGFDPNGDSRSTAPSYSVTLQYRF